MTEAGTTVLEGDSWIAARDAMARRYLGVTADEFVSKYRSGDYDDDPPDFLMDVLMYFPELD